jgi:signal transduction histidine kinase
MRLEEIVDAAKYPEIVTEEAEAALQQVERLAEVVSHLIGRTRRSAAASPESIAVDDLVAQQFVEWEPAFRRQHRRLEITGKKALVAYATPGALSQVVATLLDNALAHGKGTVTIRTSETPRTVVVSVRDEGEGVPDELADRIFERHVSGRPGGTGLGLALARGIADADGSRVVLVRPRPAVFAVFVPRGPREGETATEPPVTGPA